MMKLFQQGDFQINQNTTPEMLKRKRERIAASMPQYGKADYIGEGLGQLFHGIGSGRSEKRLDDFEAGKTSEAMDAYNAGPGGPMSILGMRPQPEYEQPQQSEAGMLGNDVMSALGKPSQDGMGSDAIRQGLISRGLPEHVADGFMMNFQDESGMNPGINEQNPTVPGSRGGFGLAQWTGPRRRALEAFAAERGVPAGDANMQLDFLMTELQGPESNAAQSIFGASDSGQAGAAIVNKFLRPAEAHRASREARYTGGQAAPQGQPPRVAGGQDMDWLMKMAANPYLPFETQRVIQQQIQQQQGLQQASDDRYWRQQDPMYQAQLAQAQLNLDQDRSGLGASAAKVQTSVVLDDGSTVMVMSDGSRRVLSPLGDALNGQAAADAIKSARAYEVENQQAIYGGRRSGTLAADIALAGDAAGAKVTGENLADIATGGEAARVIAQGSADGKRASESSGEVAEMQRNMPGLLTVADQLAALADKATYTLAGRGINEVRKQIGLDPTEGAKARAEYIAVVDNQVLPLLRQTFGAAFTAKEGDTLRMTLGDPDKSPAEKKAVLDAFIAQKQRDLFARTGGATAPSAGGSATFEQFAAEPSAIAAAQKYGVTLKEMWAIKQGQQ
jgi:hypothetical protein